MKISTPSGNTEPNCFLFTDDEENRIYVEWNMEKSELVDIFLDEYDKLVEKRNWDYDLFYDELQKILKPKWINIKYNILSIVYP